MRAIYGATPYLSDPLPSGQHRPGDWIGRYAKRRLNASGLTTIDAFLLTHLHGDHVGYLAPDGPVSPDGTYQLNRDVFATLVKQENCIANKKTDDLKSRAGHIVIRVEPGGETFAVHILSNADESDTVTASFGPYIS